jgi:hypothetical protein
MVPSIPLEFKGGNIKGLRAGPAAFLAETGAVDVRPIGLAAASL